MKTRWFAYDCKCGCVGYGEVEVKNGKVVGSQIGTCSKCNCPVKGYDYYKRWSQNLESSPSVKVFGFGVGSGGIKGSGISDHDIGE